jgi:hypothetical protein
MSGSSRALSVGRLSPASWTLPAGTLALSVHSSVMSAANDARLATFRRNARFIKGVRWLATLDGHVCVRCAALDGQAWDLDGRS